MVLGFRMNPGRKQLHDKEENQSFAPHWQSYRYQRNNIFVSNGIGGTISDYPSKSNLQDVGALFAKEHNVVIQETRDTPSKTIKETMGTKTPLEEEQRRR